MKTIELSDEDYDALMKFSKELQTQDNNGQRFPYYWCPSSEKLEYNVNDEGEETFIFDSSQCESYTPEQYAEVAESLWSDYLTEKGEIGECGYLRDYIEDDEYDWIEYINANSKNTRVYTKDWNREVDYNPSLFYSDVENYCKTNKHHLGRKPSPYSHSFWRMPKMEALVEIIYRVNKQPKELVNEEARRFVYKE